MIFVSQLSIMHVSFILLLYIRLILFPPYISSLFGIFEILVSIESHYITIHVPILLKYSTSSSFVTNEEGLHKVRQLNNIFLIEFFKATLAIYKICL